MDIKAFRGLSGTYNVRANERVRSTPLNIECLVYFLDNTRHKFVIDRRAKGQCLLDLVFKHLNLIETDFFGLKYIPQCQDINRPKVDTHILDDSTVLNKKDQLSNDAPTLVGKINATTASNNCNNTSNHNNLIKSITKEPNRNSTSTPSPQQVGVESKTNNNSPKTISSTLSNGQFNLNDLNSGSLEERWVDQSKVIRKQFKTGPPYVFYFRVKFYVSDPSKLADDTTRNHLYLQLRQDILNNRILVPTCSAILLASYILQSEVGNYKRELLDEDYVSKFRLLPLQTDDIKKKIIELHKQHKSLTASDAEYQFLEHAAKKLDCYGVEFYEANDHNQIPVQIGVSSNGIVVFKNDKKISQFSWAKIIKIMFKKRLFSIQLRRDEGEICDNFIEFNLLSNQACKSFWEECVAQHSFFRLHQPKSPPKKFFSFLNFGSKFQYNGKTEYQTMEESRKRSFSHFSRSPSKRYARRTLPVGRPSWSDSASNDNHVISNGDEKSRDAVQEDQCHVSIRSLTSNATPSSSISKSLKDNLRNESAAQGSNAYKPKSLTLKSFIYIDDSKSISTNELIDSVDANKSPSKTANEQDQELEDLNALKKPFKRTESLKISNSIRGAISLTKKAGISSSTHLVKISESLRDRFLTNSKSKQHKSTKMTDDVPDDETDISDDNESDDDIDNVKVVKLLPGQDGKYGFKIRQVACPQNSRSKKYEKSSKGRLIIIHDVSVNSPAATCNPRLYEGDRVVAINGVSIEGLSESKVENLIKNIHNKRPPDLILDVIPMRNDDTESISSSIKEQEETINSRGTPNSKSSRSLAESIEQIKKSLENKDLIEDFEKLSRKNEDESHEESRLMENIDKNRYQDILPYDSTRVQLIDSMTGDYINASFVDMVVPSGIINRYIATQGPLSSTCDDFWQMVWEQNSSLIIMVTPLIEGGRVKCHKYWPAEKIEIRYGQLLVRNISEKSKTAFIDRTMEVTDIKSGEKRIVTQIQYKAWPDHEVPEDCSDFLKLVARVKKFRQSKPNDPIVVHCSAGIGRTGVLILMETAICTMEAGEPIYPIKILTEMRKQRAMLIQTSSQFQFVAEAICRVYDQKLYSKSRKRRKK